VGIGTVAPLHALHVFGNVKGDSSAQLLGANNPPLNPEEGMLYYNNSASERRLKLRIELNPGIFTWANLALEGDEFVTSNPNPALGPPPAPPTTLPTWAQDAINKVADLWAMVPLTAPSYVKDRLDVLKATLEQQTETLAELAISHPAEIAHLEDELEEHVNCAVTESKCIENDIVNEEWTAAKNHTNFTNNAFADVLP